MKNHPKLRKFLVGLGITFAVLISLAAVAAAYENWSGAREWERVHTMLVNEGVSLDVNDLKPEMPPASENFAAQPMIRAMMDFSYEGENGAIVYQDPDLVERFQRIKLPETEDATSAKWREAQPADYAPLVAAILESGLFADLPKDGSPAETILRAIDTFHPDLSQIDQAAMRPKAVIDYKIGDTFLEQISLPLPFAEDFMSFAKLQSARAGAALEQSDLELAKMSLLSLRQTAHAIGSTNFLVSHLIRVALENMLLSHIWAGLESESWDEESLVWLDSLLQDESESILTNLEHSLTLELCIFQIGGIDFLKDNHAGPILDAVDMLSADSQDYFLISASRFIPNGVWDHNKASSCRVMFENSIRPVRERRLKLVNARDTFENRNHRNFMAAISATIFQGLNERSFEIATGVELARIAIAAERFKLAKGNYPETAAELVPEFFAAIPTDYFSPNRKPLIYLRDGDRYRVYSVGSNGVDDGGSTDELQDSHWGETTLDLVWRYNASTGD